MPDWILPWLVAAALVWPLIQVENWMHKHIQGLGLLLTNNPQAAVLVYYLLLLPGVALHEVTQWLAAQAMRIPVKRFQLWPEKDKDGTIRLGMVDIDRKHTDMPRSTVFGMIPVISGIAVITLISSTRFDVPALLAAFNTGDAAAMWAGFNVFIATPDFWLWIYLIFAVTNAMLPEPNDEINWWYLIVPFATIGLVLWIMHLSLLNRGLFYDIAFMIQAVFEVPITRLGQWLSLALGFALGVDLAMMGLITLIELFFSRVLDRELEYS